VLIDWFTVAAQALNFLILVWLLKRYLYQPVLDAIGAREQRIAMQLADANSKAAAATKQRDELERKNHDFDAQRDALLAEATADANAERQRLLQQARQEAEALRLRLQDTLRSEHQSLSGEIVRKTRDEVFAIARQALTDLATTSLEDSMAQVFVERVRGLSAQDKQSLAASTAAGAGAVVVRSAFELPPLQRTAIEQALAEICSSALRVSYQSVPDLIGGVELSAGGRKIAWSIADYLGALEYSVAQTLAAQPAPKEAPDSATAPAVAVAATNP
jgi:F-type H+-transporting ATPase subunit b